MGVYDCTPDANDDACAYPLGTGYAQSPSQHHQHHPPSYPHDVPSSSRSCSRPEASRKRKAADLNSHPSEASNAYGNYIDSTQDSPPRKRNSRTAKALEVPDCGTHWTRAASKPQDEEKRLRRWRGRAPSSYLEIRDRALTQRMFVIDRQRHAHSGEDSPTEIILLAGTTGNVYTVVVDKVPSCDCPHARKGNQCKHIVYVLNRVSRAPAHLQYQLAFVSAELREIFAKAPPLPSETADKDDEHDGNRKAIEGECPICCDDFEPNSGEKIFYCKAACGNNVHARCFQQWAATKKAQGTAITCPFCRTPWESDANKEIARGPWAKEGPRNAEGYVNIARQLGLSGRRDYSTYHGYWVRQQARNGEIGWDDDGVMGHDLY